MQGAHWTISYVISGTKRNMKRKFDSGIKSMNCKTNF